MDSAQQADGNEAGNVTVAIGEDDATTNSPIHVNEITTAATISTLSQVEDGAELGETQHNAVVGDNDEVIIEENNQSEDNDEQQQRVLPQELHEVVEEQNEQQEENLQQPHLEEQSVEIGNIEVPRLDPLVMIEPLLLDDEMQGAQQQQNAEGANQNLMLEDDNDDVSSSSSDIVYEDLPPVSGRPRQYYIATDRINAAVREVIAQGRRGEGGVAGMLNRDNLRQHIRRVIFSINHSGHRNRSSGDGDGGDYSMDVENENENIPDIEDGDDTIEEELQTIEQEPENPIRFDTNLPAEHSYLGSNMNRVSGVNYLDVGQPYHLMLFMHQHVLFPGEVLPFMISGTIIESDIDSQNGLLFGVCFPYLCSTEQDEYFYGVTCQIYEKGTDSRGNTLIKSRALQRFVTKSEFTGPLQFIAGQPQLKCYGYIKVLPEIYLPEPLRCINMGSMNRFRDLGYMEDTFKRFQAATTPWPAHVYDYYSIQSIVEKARTQLAQHKIDTMPTDPVHLSFWLVRNLHLSESMMKTIFLTDSVNTRMKLISSTFKEEAIFTCRYCSNRIANCRELFAMSKHGVQTQYCNSAGYIHETNTVYQLLRDAIQYSGEPSSEFSWFPGYQWHIINCKICSRHIGWEFKALEPNLVPKTFFGISSASVRISSGAQLLPDPRAVIYRSFLRFVRREMQ